MKQYILTLILVLLLPASVIANEKAIHDAICDGNLSRVKQLLPTKAKINTLTHAEGEYPLELAAYCYGGQPELVKYFLDKGADVNLHRKNNYSSLMWAIRSMGSASSDLMRDQVFRMIKMGARVNYTDSTTGRTPLMGAAGLGDEELVKLLLAKGADKSPRTTGDWCVSGSDVKCSAADHARMGGYVTLALKLEGKSDADYKKTLNYAIKQNDVARVRQILASTNDPDQLEVLSNLSSLFYAVEVNSVEITKMLLQAGAKPNNQNYAGVTPLRDAIVYSKEEIAKALIDGGARADNTQKQGCGGGMTEYNWAWSYGAIDIARYIIEKKAINFKDKRLVFNILYGSSFTIDKDLDFANYLIKNNLKPEQVNVDQLYEWQSRDSDSARLRLIDLYKKEIANQDDSENNPDVEVVMPDSEEEEEEYPDVPDFESSISNLDIQFRGMTNKRDIKSRSLKKTDPKVERALQQFTNKQGILRETDRMP